MRLLTSWIGAISILALALLPGCFTGGATNQGTSAGGDAVVVIRLGGDALPLSGGGGEGLAPQSAVPADIASIDLRVSGSGMIPFSKRYTVPQDGNLTIEETFSVGTQRHFEIDALDANGVIFYQGSTDHDLVAGANTITIQMESRGYVAGSVFYLSSEFPFGPTDVYVTGDDITFQDLAGGTPTTAPVTSGNFQSAPLPLADYRVEISPTDCVNAGWDGCLAFGEIALTTPGQTASLSLFVIPPVGSEFDIYAWASSVVPNSGATGDTVMMFGRNFVASPYETYPEIYFNLQQGGGGRQFDMTDAGADYLTGAVPGDISNGAGWVTGEQYSAAAITYSNPIPFTVNAGPGQ